MSKLELSLAIGNYDRCRPLIDGAVQIDGVKPVIMTLSPEEIFFRAFRNQEFDICELSLSSSTLQVANGNFPYVGIPVFLSRAFRHTAIYCRTDRIQKPEDLRGKKIGLPEYQLTANVWVRAILEEDYGLKPSDVTWVRGGISHAGRPEKLKIKLPDDVRVEDAPEGETISSLLAKGEIDGYVAPRAPDVPEGTPNLGWLFRDPVEAAKDYYRRTRIFPIMHILGVRRELAERHPWLPGAIYKAFEESKVKALEHLSETSATKITLPFVEERLKEARDLMGQDHWSYGIEANRHVLENFFKHHHAQGLSPRLVTPEDMFHPGTFESFSI
ncbi:ABC transporter substrate-binding protein [Comamonas sp. NoAH]|uniref:ABC transporter substrate-binding protein n=1 Tax=Comamonas halotolerans TaxID=3041496 RepID=UPI0024E135A0|nr:ABC transporter substrate-binding protein [Comamonas sp. NoAH]